MRRLLDEFLGCVKEGRLFDMYKKFKCVLWECVVFKYESCLKVCLLYVNGF